MIQRFLGPIGAREAPRDNHPSSGFNSVTETYTKLNPTLHGPCGLGGVVHSRITEQGTTGTNNHADKAKATIPKQRTQIGTWNVRTMYQAGKVHQVSKEMRRLNLAILGISEARWLGSDKSQLLTGETLLYSGPTGDSSSHEKGVALMLSKQAAKSHMEWEPISKRIIMASFESKFQVSTILQTYAPTNKADEEEKEDFNNQLQAAFNKTKKRDIILVMGNLNAKVGSDNQNRERTIRSQGVGIINENEELFCDFCATKGLVIGGPLFRHKTSHKVTWRSPDDMTENQIDHVAISRK